MNDEFSRLFSRSSESFRKANPSLFAAKPTGVRALAREVQGQEKSDDRVIVGIVMFRCRVLDKDNAYAATKSLTDCLREVGLILDDSQKQIDLRVTQERVAHRDDQRTEVTLIWPTNDKDSSTTQIK